MSSPRRIPLGDLQPSQLYVSSDKLASVLAAWPDADPATHEPLPVKRYGDLLVLTDGHTRAVAAHRRGLAEIRVVTDEDDLDDAAYERCVAWCREADIESIAELAARVVGAEDYEQLWLDRCRALHRELEASRSGRSEGL